MFLSRAKSSSRIDSDQSVTKTKSAALSLKTQARVEGMKVVGADVDGTCVGCAVGTDVERGVGTGVGACVRSVLGAAAGTEVGL